MSYSYAQSLLRISIAWSLLFSTPYGVPLADSHPPSRQPAEVMLPGEDKEDDSKESSPAAEPNEAEHLVKTPPRKAPVLSPYCEATPEGGIRVKPALLENGDLSNALTEWKQKADTVYTKLSKARNSTLISEAGIQEIPGVLSETDSAIAELKKEVVALVEQLPAAFGEDAKEIVTNYFQIISFRIELEQFQNPMKWGLNDLRLHYALEFSAKTERSLFVIGGFSLPGVDLDPVQQDGKTVYRLSLGAESTFHSLVRAAARSTQVGGKEKRYLETVRCILGRGILGKYAINKTILDRGEIGQPIDPNLNFCLGAKGEDFMDLTKRDTDFSREMVLRANFIASVPQIASHLPREIQKYLVENDLLEQIAQLSAFPELIDEVNVDRRNNGIPLVELGQFAKVLAIIDAVVNEEYKKFKAWEDLRLMWRKPSVQGAIDSLLDGCGVEGADRGKKRVSFGAYWAQMMRADDLMFLTFLANDVSGIPGRWLEMDKAQLTQALREYIITKKVESSMRALAFFVYRKADGNSAPAKELLQVTHDDLTAMFTNEFTQMWDKNAELTKWLDGVVDKIQAERADAGNFQKLLTSFTQELMKGAQAVQKIMDPKRLVSTLPYVEKHVLGSLNSTIRALSPDNRRRYILLRDETDPAKRYVMWQGIEKLLQKETAAVGATCEGKPGIIERTSRTFGSWFGIDTASKKLKANEDCHRLTTVALAIGANRTTTPTDMTYTVNALQERIPDTVKDFLDVYRERLAVSLTAEQRLLMFPVKVASMWDSLKEIGVTPQGEVALEPEDEPLWQKIVRVNDAKKLEPDVLLGLKYSVADLGKYLKVVTEAKSEKDLMFLIKRTNIINSILGQDSIDQKGVLDRLNPVNSGERVTRVLSNGDIGFVFPTLVQYNRELQDKLIRDEEFNREVWSEFYEANLNVVYWILGGWAAKYALGILPRFAGGPAVASLVDKAGGRISGMIGIQADYVTLLLVGNMGRSYLDKRDFEAELGQIRALNTSEGVAMMAGSPYALLTEDQFLKQKLYFEEAIKNAESEIQSTAMWLAFPLLLGHGMKLFNTGLNYLRMGRNKNYDAVGHYARQRFQREFGTSIMINRKMLTNDLNRLGTQKIEVSALQAARDAAILRATDAAEKSVAGRLVAGRKKFLANESYERIIIRFGRDIEGLARMPHMQQSYANALYGSGGSVRNLESIYQEYQRIMRAAR